MWELLAVLGIYLAVSFVGMAALWTVGVRKGVVRAPSYFFWIRASQSNALPSLKEASPSNSYWNIRPVNLAAATAVLLYTMSTSEVVPHSGLAGEVGPNQMTRSNALIGS